MILKIINHNPTQTTFCYIPDIYEVEFKFGILWARQKDFVGFTIECTGLTVKFLDSMDTDETCPSILEQPVESDIRKALKLD